jgi:integrase
MAARPRSRKRRDWPRGLHESRPGYFVWDNPVTGKSVPIGRVPLADAKLQAIEANLWAQDQLAAPRLVDRLTAGEGLTLAQWLTQWVEGLATADDLAKNTLKAYRTSVRAVCTHAADALLARTTVKVVADALEAIAEHRGARTAQACRSVLKTAFSAAMAKGLMDSNPALVTDAVKVRVQRTRFTWETFQQVWRALDSEPAWLRNATALALISGQRREDIVSAAFGDISDEVWRLTQAKTGRKLAIPLDLRLDVLGMSLRDVVAACRRTAVVSRHLIHQTQPRGNSPVGAPIFQDTLTKRFTAAVQQVLGPGETLPTFHELRSLSKRLYDDQGGVDTKALLGHSTERMAAVYKDARGAEFERVRIG